MSASANAPAVKVMECTPAELPELLAMIWGAGRIPITHGKPGLGKTQMHEQVAAALGMPFLSFRAAQKDPTAIAGIGVPDRERRVLDYFPDAQWPTVATVINFDELNRAPVMTQNVVFELFDSGRIGNSVLPPGCFLAATVNGEADGGGVVRMPQALNNRFVHLYLKVKAQDWLTWAIDSGLHPITVAYINGHPDDLHKFSRTEDAFPTPRTWHFVSDLLTKNPDLSPRMAHILFSGALGYQVGTDFAAFYATFARLPDLGPIRLNPDTAPLPQDPSSRWVTANSIANTLDDRTAHAFLRYLDRMPEECGVFAVKMALRRDPKLSTNGSITAWTTKHQDAF